MNEGGNLRRNVVPRENNRDAESGPSALLSRLASVLYRHQSYLISTTQLYLRTKTFIQRYGSSGMCVPGWTIVSREAAQRDVRHRE